MADPEPYVCSLDAKTQEKALQELYEDPKNRQGAIDTLRVWIKQQQHLKCPIDNMFILGFLRAKHFSQLEARQGLEYFMNLRDKHGSWMKNLDPSNSNIKKILEETPMLLLPGRDKHGRKVVLFRPGVFDWGDKVLRMSFFRLFCLVCYYNYFCDEQTQVHGTVYLVDFTGHTMANEMKTPLEEKKIVTTLMQKTFPARVKGFHLYNTGTMIEFVMGLIGRIFTEKLKKRLKVHNHGLESVYDHIPMEILPQEYLPDDYTGPNAGTMEQCHVYMKAELNKSEIRDRLKYLSNDEFFIKMKEKDTDVPVASFRKLNVD